MMSAEFRWIFRLYGEKSEQANKASFFDRKGEKLPQLLIPHSALLTSLAALCAAFCFKERRNCL
ncbi:MAG: hypothetical protein IJX08_02690 [Clostridia bacterium]|nr:hypothetical protein [Clostridia bacterium]